MSIIEICISFQVAIMGIAHPIILQVATDLDEKYESILVTELLNKELIQKWFKYTLYISLTLTLGYVGWNLFYFHKITPSTYTVGILLYLIIFFTFLLIVSFLLYVKKVLLFYSTKDFVRYLMREDGKN